MKTLAWVCLFIFTATISASAQDDCLGFFPKEEGVVLQNKGYNANNELICSITFKVNKFYDYPSGINMLVGVTLSNAKDSVIEKGVIDISCNDGTFYFKSSNGAISPKLIESLGSNTILLESFMAPPTNTEGTAIEDYPYIDETESIDIETIKEHHNIATVRIIDRTYDKDDLISTPAGIFQAVKVNFSFKITENGTSTIYKGSEWYAADAGIVRSEIYDQNNKIKNYTVLSSLKKN